MHTNKQTYILIYMHSYRQRHIHTYTQTHIHTYMHAYRQASIPTEQCAYTYIHISIHTCS